MALTLGAVLVLFALALWGFAARQQASTGLPAARVLTDDTDPGRPPDAPLVSHRYQLVGRPDYLLERRGDVIPVEVKPTRRAETPYEGDLLQLVAYCLLVEDVLGRRPPYGVLRYADRSWAVPYDDVARATVVARLADMTMAEGAADVPRSHEVVARCRGCGVRDVCSARLDA